MYAMRTSAQFFSNDVATQHPSDYNAAVGSAQVAGPTIVSSTSSMVDSAQGPAPGAFFFGRSRAQR
jgi:hypothetical protein